MVEEREVEEGGKREGCAWGDTASVRGAQGRGAADTADGALERRQAQGKGAGTVGPLTLGLWHADSRAEVPNAQARSTRLSGKVH